MKDSDGRNWHEIASGTFPDPRACVPLGLKVIQLGKVEVGHHVQYWCKSYYGDGCSLQYIAVFQGIIDV